MFQLTRNEFENLKFHFGTSSWGGTRKLPLIFTENGVAMLSSVLNSERAIKVNIQIMRTFTKIREMLATHKDRFSNREGVKLVEKGDTVNLVVLRKGTLLHPMKEMNYPAAS